MRFSRERLFRTRICPPVKCRECNCRAYCAEIVALALHYAWSTAPKFVTLPPLLRPSSSDTLPSSPIFPALITCMYAGRHTWPPDKARNLPPSSRRFSNTAASSGTAGRERWRIWAWPVPMPCNRELFKDTGSPPMPPASRPRRLQRFPNPLERRRPRRIYPQASQSGIRKLR